jgi:hypothetical protein
MASSHGGTGYITRGGWTPAALTDDEHSSDPVDGNGDIILQRIRESIDSRFSDPTLGGVRAEMFKANANAQVRVPFVLVEIRDVHRRCSLPSTWPLFRLFTGFS